VTETATKAWGFGLATLDSAGTLLDVWFPSPTLGESPADAGEPEELTALAGKDSAQKT
jgi:2,3,4,5-tetrahydropyridine-2-carboxylate N-succinyltransferase